MDLELKGKRAVVLGASRGLGAAIAQELTDEGVSVLGVSRSPNEASEWPMLAIDLAAPDAAETIASHAQRELGGVDILVNNCGGPTPSTAHETDAVQLLGAFQPMLLTITEITRLVLPDMRASGFGRIMTITSAGVREPIPGLALSNTMRAAVHGWMKTLAREVAMDGVTVNMLMPGQVETERLHSLHQNIADQAGVDLQVIAAKAAESIPAGRFGEPREFAAVAAFLASSRASYVTGLEIPIDGGFLRS